MGGLTGSDPAEEAAGRMLDYYRELELLIALLVAQYGQAHEGGFRYIINDEDAFALRRLIGTMEPVVIQTHDAACARYVIDVL